MSLFKKIIFLLLVGHSLFAQPKREFRGVWIANVGNVDWPSTKGLSAEKQQEELVDMLDMIQKQGLNAVFFQIRNACDAVYESQLEPWSEWLTGQQGQSPGYDPLAFMIQECRKRNLEIHAWMNPYRAVTDTRTASIAPNHVLRVRPDVLLSYGPLRILDPGKPEVRSFVSHVVMDVVRRYDIDGIHFDDYFYPYPQAGITLNDNNTFKSHSRGFTNRADWRRDNVNLLIEAISDSIHRVKPWVKFGVSPFGIWQNQSSSSEGSNSRGFEAYSGNYADSRKWVQEGWVDYIAPQVYWSMGNNGSASYTNLVPWWSKNVSEQHLYIGQGIYKINSDAYWRKPLETSNQIKFNRTFSNVNGSILFSAKTLRNNPNGVSNTLSENVYQTKALIPIMPWKSTSSPIVPSRLNAKINTDNTVTLTWAYPFPLTSEREKARYFVLYRSERQSPIDFGTGQCIRATIVNNNEGTSFTFTDREVKSGMKYNYTLSAVNRLHNESRPTQIVSISTLNSTKNSIEAESIVESKPSPRQTPEKQPYVVQAEVSKKTVEETDAKQEEEDSHSDELLQVFPNPFNQQISIRYRLPAAAEVSLYVYDSRGTRVGALVVNQKQDVGNYAATFNGQFLSDGTYFARLMAGEIQKTVKMVLKR